MARTTFRWAQLSFKEAIELFSEQLNVDTDSWRDISGVEQLAAFMVASAKGGLLSDLREEVQKAIELGITLSEFRDRFDEIVERRGWSYRGNRDWRSNLIWETNLRAAYGLGREIQIQQVKDERPYAIWRHGGSADPRPEHIANDGKVYRVDERPTKLPYGYGCKCVWFTLSERDMNRLELTLSDPLPVPDEEGWDRSLGVPGEAERERLKERLVGRFDNEIAPQVLRDVEQ